MNLTARYLLRKSDNEFKEEREFEKLIEFLKELFGEDFIKEITCQKKNN